MLKNTASGNTGRRSTAPHEDRGVNAEPAYPSSNSRAVRLDREVEHRAAIRADEATDLQAQRLDGLRIQIPDDLEVDGVVAFLTIVRGAHASSIPSKQSSAWNTSG